MFVHIFPEKYAFCSLPKEDSFNTHCRTGHTTCPSILENICDFISRNLGSNVQATDTAMYFMAKNFKPPLQNYPFQSKLEENHNSFVINIHSTKNSIVKLPSTIYMYTIYIFMFSSMKMSLLVWRIHILNPAMHIRLYSIFCIYIHFNDRANPAICYIFYRTHMLVMM